MATALIIGLYVVSFVSPTMGFALFWRRANRDLQEGLKRAAARGSKASTVADFNTEYADITARPRQARRDIGLEAGLVGLGLLAGAVAGVWSLYAG